MNFRIEFAKKKPEPEFATKINFRIEFAIKTNF